MHNIQHRAGIKTLQNTLSLIHFLSYILNLDTATHEIVAPSMDRIPSVNLSEGREVCDSVDRGYRGIKEKQR